LLPITRKRAVWLYALATLTLAGVGAVPAFISGRLAEDVMRGEWYVVRGSWRQHEDTAEIATVLSLAAGAVAALAWWRLVRGPDRDSAALPAWLRAAVLATALVTSGAMTLTAYQGGRIIHKSRVLLEPRPTADSLTSPPAPRNTGR
jgi:hypothetical protein